MTLLAPKETTRTGGPRTAPIRGHLRQVDVVRVLTFVCVIAVHALSHTNGASRNAAIAGMLLHFTREVFFVITGFVLFHTHYRKPFDARHFLRRRCWLVAAPYFTWTVIYLEYNAASWPATGGWWHTLGYDLLTGSAAYHLYFLLVTLQIYLALPLLLWIVRKTAGHHGLLFGTALAIEVAETWALHSHDQGVTGFAGLIVRQSGTLLPSYLLYVVAGALAAVHLGRWQALIDRHRAATVWLLAAAATLTIWVHNAQIHRAADIGPATDVLQPVMVLWSLAVAIALYALGSAWVVRQPSRRALALLDETSHMSFGVYLIHPLLLGVISEHWLGLGNGWVKAPVSTLLLIAVTVAASVAAVAVLQRTRLSLLLTGRPTTAKVPVPIPATA